MCEPIYEMKELKRIEAEIAWNATAVALTNACSFLVLLILWAHRIINMTLMMCALWSFSWHLQRTIIIIPGIVHTNFVGHKLNEKNVQKTNRNKTLFYLENMDRFIISFHNTWDMMCVFVRFVQSHVIRFCLHWFPFVVNCFVFCFVWCTLNWMLDPWIIVYHILYNVYLWLKWKF